MPPDAEPPVAAPPAGMPPDVGAPDIEPAEDVPLVSAPAEPNGGEPSSLLLQAIDKAPRTKSPWTALRLARIGLFTLLMNIEPPPFYWLRLLGQGQYCPLYICSS